MAESEMAGQARGLGPTREKRPSTATPSGGRATDTAPPCDLGVLLGEPSSGSTLNHQLPTRLRVALVHSDQSVHLFTRKAFEAHAKGWTLESHLTPESAFSALRFMPASSHSAPGKVPTCRDVPHMHGPPDELLTLPSNDHHPDAPHSHAAPDVVLMEARLPGLSGIDFARRLMNRLPGMRIVMLITCANHNTIVESLMAGACGCLIKPAPEYLVWAISQVAKGQHILCGEAQAAVMDYLRSLGATCGCKQLSWREREIMLRIMDGTPNKDIAAELGISEGTIHWHLDIIFKKLRVHGKDEARRRFMGGGAAGELVLSGCGLKTYYFPTLCARLTSCLISASLWYAPFQRPRKARGQGPAEGRLQPRGNGRARCGPVAAKCSPRR